MGTTPGPLTEAGTEPTRSTRAASPGLLPAPSAASRTGIAFGVGAYVLWGVFPLYFPLLEPADPAEILAHRIVWSALVSVLLLVPRRVRLGLVDLLRDRRRMLRLSAAAGVLGVNWFTYIWGVNHGQVVQTSLGYYINPLVTVLLAVVVLRERLRRLQWIALGIGFTAVIWLTIDYGRLPWLALVLAFSFGSYGLFKKQVSAPAAQTLAVETAVLTPFAVGWLAWLIASGNSTFGQHGAVHAVLLASTGLVTAIPLLFFAGAATRLPLRVLGMLQYLAPTLQLAVGVLIMHEPLPAARLIGFGIVWLALVLLTVDGLRARRATLRALPVTDHLAGPRAATPGAGARSGG